MVMRLRGAAAAVDVGQHAELELRVLVERLAAGLDLRAEVLGDEVLIRQQFLDQLANLLAAAWTFVGFQHRVAVLAERFQRVGHGSFPRSADVFRGKTAPSGRGMQGVTTESKFTSPPTPRRA